MNKYYITGVPGIGKTTVMHELKRRGFTAFDIDYIPGLCRWVNRSTKESVEFLPGATEAWHRAHAWECDSDELKKLLDESGNQPVYVFGIADNQKEFLSLFDQVFLMRAEASVFMDRMANRTEEHFGHNADDRKTVLSWYKKFEEDLLDLGVTELDATLEVADVANGILANT